MTKALYLSIKLLVVVFKLSTSLIIYIITTRVLKMMHNVSSHTVENRMTPSAVAACMAPLLLRPLLAGECEMEDEFDVSGDGSAQLLAAANAANNAQAIITTLLEEYENVFDVCSLRNHLFVVTLNCSTFRVLFFINANTEIEVPLLF
jgi:RhoGAP domain